MAKLKKPDHENGDATIVGNNGDVVYGEQDPGRSGAQGEGEAGSSNPAEAAVEEQGKERHFQEHPADPPEQREDSWLDSLTDAQDARDNLYRNREQGDFSTPVAPITHKEDTRHNEGQSFRNPIPPKELADMLVDTTFAYIKDGGHPANWPRIMTTVGFFQQQLRRRWSELTGARTKYGKRYADLQSTRDKRMRTEQEINKTTAAEPELRGGELLAEVRQDAPSQQGIAHVPPDKGKVTGTTQMGEPLAGVATPVGSPL